MFPFQSTWRPVASASAGGINGGGLLPGALYEYQYRTGEIIEFKFDSIRANVQTGLNIYGEVFRSTRASIAPANVVQRIMKVDSLVPERLTLITDPARRSALGLGVHVDPATGMRPTRPMPCASYEDHDPINVGFMHLKLVCRKCDSDMGDGANQKKRAIGRGW